MFGFVKKHLANMISLTSLFVGCLSILATMEFNFPKAAILIFVAALLDFSDGFVARLLKTQSELGKQIDSLCDMVSFGVAPAFCMYNLSKYQVETSPLNYLAFLISVFAAMRLANFNIDERQKTYFIGLPTPAMALFVFSLPLALEGLNNGLVEVIKQPAFLGGIAVVISLLMVSPIKLFSLKFKSFDFAQNKYRYGFLVMSIGLLAMLQIIAIPVIIVLYILVSLTMQKKIDQI